MTPWGNRGDRPLRVEDRIRIEPSGTIVALSGKVEYGQGLRTAFSLIVAEELRVPVDAVRVVLGETDVAPWDMGTFGSLSVATDGRTLRLAAAFMRERLLDRAARVLAAPRETLDLQDGHACARDGGRVSYASLVSDEPVTGAVSDDVVLSPASMPADRPRRAEALAIVTGAARFAADVRLPGMLRGHALAPPVYGARLRSIEADAARALPGVVWIVHEGDFAGVVAETAFEALTAVRALRPVWDLPAETPASLDFVLRDDDVAGAFEGNATQWSARYVTPHIAHASIGPSAAVADVGPAGATVYVATQRPFPLRDEIATRLGVPKARVHVRPTFASGTYGRNGGSDAAIEAVRLSHAVGRPILVQWTRAEEFQRSPSRPEVIGEISAAVDRGGTLTGWRYEEWTNPHTYGGRDLSPQLVLGTSGRNAIPPYRVPVRARLHIREARVRTGAFRSLAAAPNVFAIESFIDENAAHLHVDPVDFRLRHLDDGRMRRVLEAVRDLSRWTSRRREHGRGYGVACAEYHGSYVAQIAKVVVAPDGRVTFERMWCAVDAGRLVHPDGARNQAEGGIQFAASWALLESLQHTDGRVESSSFKDYAIATIHDAPVSIDVAFVGDGVEPSTGMGETCTVPVAAALANAVFDACGARVRTLPIAPAAVRAAGEPVNANR